MLKNKSLRRLSLIAASVALTGVALPLITLNAGASQPRVEVAGTASLPANAVIVNKVINATFDVGLKGRHSAQLTAFIASLSNTASANYQHFLTPTTYATRFGASASTVAAVRTYFSKYGLKVGALSTGRDLIHVAGSTTEIAKALDAPVETVRLSGGNLAARITNPATVPAAIANDVVSVAGLSAVQPAVANIETANIESAHAVTTAGTCSSAGATTGDVPNANGYTVQQQAALYGFSTAWAEGDTGVGQTIGVYELGAYDASDVATYLACYGVSPTITTTNIDGGPTSDASGASDSADEATLDVEEAAVLAPGATIHVYQGPNTNNGPIDVYSKIASDNTATVITTSWGNCEADTDGTAQTEQEIFEQMATQGQTVVSAAGDDGSADCDGDGTSNSSSLEVDDPSSQPYVTGVGGLTVSATSPLSETVWNDCTPDGCGAGGGGESDLWAQPAWQKNFGITTTAATGGMRMVPDVSVMADPDTGFIQYFTGTTTGECRKSCQGWSGIGGTSIGAPLVSALVAVAAQSCSLPSGRLGFINPTLYTLPSSAYVDVTTGSNDLDKLGKYSATTGYDMASGLGSPNGATFIADLCPPALSTTNSTFTPATAGTTASVATINATLRDVNDNPVANATVEVTAKAIAGTITIDGAASSGTDTGTGTYDVTSSTTGALSVDIASSVAQDVAVTLSYEDATIYSTTVSFKAAATKPDAPTIKKLTALAGGFALTLGAPDDVATANITKYQYKLNGGATWVTIASKALSVRVTKLVNHKSYSVRVRAVNAVGASVASAAKKVVTLS